MSNVMFETRDLRVRIADQIARVDQRRLDGEPWREIDQNALPLSQTWLVNPRGTSPLKVALIAFEREHPGDQTLRVALGR